MGDRQPSIARYTVEVTFRRPRQHQANPSRYHSCMLHSDEKPDQAENNNSSWFKAFFRNCKKLSADEQLVSYLGFWRSWCEQPAQHIRFNGQKSPPEYRNRNASTPQNIKNIWLRWELREYGYNLRFRRVSIMFAHCRDFIDPFNKIARSELRFSTDWPVSRVTTPVHFPARHNRSRHLFLFHLHKT